MMGFMALIIVAAGAVFSMVWLVHYIPLISKKLFFKGYWSPRMFLINRFLEPMDAGLTMILVGGGWVGFTSAIGISATVYNVLSGIGLSIGVVAIKKWFGPRWQKQYEQELQQKLLELGNKVKI